MVQFTAYIPFYGTDTLRGLVALQDLAVATDKELGEVPFDVRLLVVLSIALAQHLIHKLARLVALRLQG